MLTEGVCTPVIHIPGVSLGILLSSQRVNQMFIQRFCHSNTMLPQQFGVSRWSFQRPWSSAHFNHAHHTYPSVHYSTQKAPAQLFILSRLAFGRLPVLKECSGLLVYWKLVSVVPLNTWSGLSCSLDQSTCSQKIFLISAKLYSMNSDHLLRL